MCHDSAMRKALLSLLPLLGCAPSLHSPEPGAVAAVEATLNELHAAAARADGGSYFSLFTDNATYIGTDASEHWTIDEFRAFAEPYFSKGRGWTYRPRERHVTMPAIPCRCIAWFDELLDSETYGTSRGTGVLVKRGNAWKIAQYALTFPVPNDLAEGMTNQIKAFEATKR